MKTAVEARIAARFRVLKRLYEVTEANIFAMESLENLARDTGLPLGEVESHTQVLAGCGKIG